MINKDKIFLSPPHMGGAELEYIHKVFDSNYIAPMGEFVDKFEDSISSYTKAKNTLVLNSGTSAIHLALRVLGIENGDEVFASSFTFIGSISPIMYQGAKPVFIDSDENWNMSLSVFKNAISSYKKQNKKLPKALILTHLYGQVADIEHIADECRANNIFLIEDSAESLGSFYNGKHTGLFGDMGILSFNGNKIITTSGGGALISNNDEYIKQARYLSTTARQEEIHYEHIDYGYNYRLSNVLSAIGVAQMEVLEQRVARKIDIFEQYKYHLRDTNISFMPQLPESRPNRWLSTIITEKSYLPLLDELAKHNYESRPLWKPMHMQKVFENEQSFLNGVSEDLFARGLCLPSGTNMSDEHIENISNIIKSVI